jgi:hypothetical protein
VASIGGFDGAASSFVEVICKYVPRLISVAPLRRQWDYRQPLVTAAEEKVKKN